tara:strand:- start:1330 stop:1704 length:375 start_codon:yes stop_codon:yes gene_type:complete
MKFNSKIESKYISLYYFPMEFSTTIDEDPEMVHSHAYVQFHVDIDARERGIKSISTSATMIELEIGDHEVCIRDDAPILIDGVDDDTWEIVNEVEMGNGDYGYQIMVAELELDWKKRKAYVYYR